MEELSKYISTNKNKSLKPSLKRNQNVRADSFGLKKKQKPSSTYDLNHDHNSYKVMKGRDLLKEKKKNDLQKLLPVNHCREQIVDAFKKSETLLLMGETGSGKTTQIPQFLLDEGLANRGLIGVTQPRRIAAISVAKRVSQELGSSLGETVGYKVRFEDCTSSSTKIKFLTDGTLLREALRDRLLLDYKVIILDEAHERSISTDVLFGILKTAQALRKGKGLENLKLIIQSATMDIDNFSCYFGVPGMYLEGRMHPIRVMHTKEHQVDYLNSALVTLFNVHRSSPINEDVLIFLTGQEEIEMFAQRIRQILKAHSDLPGISVCPLYAQLPQHKQMECFQPSLKNIRKVVLATNIAETSITIPGIRCVIDCGFVKRRMFNISNGLEILRKVRISQAEAWQRCGRAGRDAPGRCFRTYTTKEMNFFDSMTEPELLRSNICTAVLSLLALGIDCRTFDFLDAPSPAAIKSAYHSLFSLGAIKTEINPSLTNVGLQMAQFPLDPRFSKIIINANSLGCLEQILSIISMLSSENVFISSPGTREKAALVHAKFLSKDGDLLTLLNLYNSSQKVDNIKTWCHENFINTRNLLYAREVRRQLVEICKRMNLKVNSSEPKYDEIKKCLLTGYFENIAELQQDNTYLTISTRQRAKVHPSSVYQKFCKPKYIIYNEIVLTDRFYLCQLTEISKEWVSDIVPSFK